MSIGLPPPQSEPVLPPNLEEILSPEVVWPTPPADPLDREAWLNIPDNYLQRTVFPWKRVGIVLRLAC